MKKLTYFGLFLIALLLQACTSEQTKVSTDYQPFDYSSAKTYHWYDGDDTIHHPGVSDIVHQRIKAAIDKQMAAKGFTESADGVLELNYSVNAEDRTDVNNYQVYDGYAPGFTWNRDDGAHFLKTREEYTETEIDSYREGVLIIDVLKADSNKLLWRGIGKRRLPDMVNKGDRDQLIDEVASSILKTFPPQ
ncbi:DUF4136 domain-containing protein [Agaribacterium haliotis]|uniref:DUF4136 domain-containing protein n=1 Tax=Agaribacterium haliotis TaxID=2013869 RepID=UPI000BB54EB4|nr:DUF4136 domain-containing protein [Agaribacterium haliotis]